jgi:hypothetical protein
LAQGLVLVPSPQVTGSSLVGAAAITSNDIWAVGQTFTSAGTFQTLAEHFDGTSWSVIPTPNPTSNDEFTGVAGAASNDVWAIASGTTTNPSFIEHWNGSSWSVVPSPTVQNLTGVTAPASNNVWAVGAGSGGALVEHWDGTSWSIVSSPAFAGVSGLVGVSADASNDVWAVGSTSTQSGASFSGPVALHWNGQTWSMIPAANTTVGFHFRGVTALSPTDVWGAGNTSTTGRYPKSIATVEHWDGTSWSIVPGPNSGSKSVGTALYAIAAVSANEVWAVGVNNSQTLTEQWDGTTLKIVNSPNASDVSNGLSGVTALSDGTVAAVGSQIGSTTGQMPLILQNAASAPKTAAPTRSMLATRDTSPRDAVFPAGANEDQHLSFGGPGTTGTTTGRQGGTMPAALEAALLDQLFVAAGKGDQPLPFAGHAWWLNDAAADGASDGLAGGLWLWARV